CKESIFAVFALLSLSRPLQFTLAGCPSTSVVLLQNKTCTLMKSKKTWSSAQNFCRESNSDLVTVESQVEVLKLYKLLPKSDEDAHAWIGLYQDKENWQWINGDQASYFNWSKSSLQETNTFCAVLNRLGNWEKSDCNAENDVLCYKKGKTA
uniref:C-type lectin domain-containing protein n=1 Tax=Erpetoichthys calabaricus TaxID=27687 RepID=A0A8C4RQV8_ERPCA